MSSTAVFSATTLTGVDHAADRFGRLDTQMSVVPTPPGRSEPNQSVSPSAEIAALVSNVLVLTSVDRRRRPNGWLAACAAGEPDVAVAARDRW